jgi:hypothetical protein
MTKYTYVIQYHGKYWGSLDGKFVLYNDLDGVHVGLDAEHVTRAAQFDTLEQSKQYVENMFKQDIDMFRFYVVAASVDIFPA